MKKIELKLIFLYLSVPVLFTNMSFRLLIFASRTLINKLGQAQLKLALAFTNMISKKYIARPLVSHCLLRGPNWHFMPFKSDLKHQSYE